MQELMAAIALTGSASNLARRLGANISRWQHGKRPVSRPQQGAIKQLLAARSLGC